MEIIRQIKVEVTPTPAEMAEVFASWCGDNQAVFFEELSKQVAQWEISFCFQAHNIADIKYLTKDGRHIMQIIGEYGNEI